MGQLTLSFEATLSETTSNWSRRYRRADLVGLWQADGRIGAHHPQAP